MSEEEDLNSISDIRKFLNKGEVNNPVSMQEFSEWWKTLSDEEKVEYKNTPLPE